MRPTTTIVAVILVVLLGSGVVGQADRVSIRVDATKFKGEMTPVWRFFGYDEPNPL